MKKEINLKVFTIGIIGYGKFGRLIYKLIVKNFKQVKVKIYSRNHKPNNIIYFNFKEVSECDFIIPCVPISCFEDIIKKISIYIKSGKTIIDICSVKDYPKKVMLKWIKKEVNLICTHPMFGPATYKKMGNKTEGLNVVIDPIRCKSKVYKEFINTLKNIYKLNVIEMDSEEHDRMVARFHFLSQVIAFLVEKMDLKRSRIDTKSFSVLMDFSVMVSPDVNLIRDMYKYNKFCKEELKRFKYIFTGLVSNLECKFQKG